MRTELKCCTITERCCRYCRICNTFVIVINHMTSVYLENAHLNMCDCVRDLRLRQCLGTRYDAIPNVFDWDFHMKLVDKGVSRSLSALLLQVQFNQWLDSSFGYMCNVANPCVGRWGRLPPPLVKRARKIFLTLVKINPATES